MDTTAAYPLRWTPIDQLYCSPSNPRHNDHAVEHVASSLRRFGWQQPIVARPSGEVIAGNTRLKAAQSLGMTEVPVHTFEGSDVEATAFAIADNETGEIADWDDDALAKLIRDLKDEDALDGIGFDDDEIDDILASLEADSREDIVDPGPEPPPETPTSRRGDLWILGDHRLLCGDSTSADDVARVLDGESRGRSPGGAMSAC